MNDGGKLRLRDEQLSWREIDGEVVAADLRNSNYLATNEAGTLLWAALSEGVTREELIARLMAEYGLDRELAEHDVAAFIESLHAQGLLAQ